MATLEGAGRENTTQNSDTMASKTSMDNLLEIEGDDYDGLPPKRPPKPSAMVKYVQLETQGQL